MVVADECRDNPLPSKSYAFGLLSQLVSRKGVTQAVLGIVAGCRGVGPTAAVFGGVVWGPFQRLSSLWGESGLLPEAGPDGSVPVRVCTTSSSHNGAADGCCHPYFGHQLYVRWILVNGGTVSGERALDKRC